MTIGPEDDVTTGPLHFDDDRQIPVPARQPRPGHGGAGGPGHGDRRGGNAGLGREGGRLLKRSVIRLPTGPRRSRSSINVVTWTVLDESVAADFERLANGDRGEFRHDLPVARRSDVDRRLRPGRRPGGLLPVRSGVGQPGVPVLQPPGAREDGPGADALRGRPVARSARHRGLLQPSRGLDEATARTGPPNRCRRSSGSMAARGHGTVGATMPCTSS